MSDEPKDRDPDVIKLPTAAQSAADELYDSVFPGDLIESRRR